MPILHLETQRIIKAFLTYSLLQDGAYLKYEEMTEMERSLCTKEQYDRLINWIMY